MKKLFIILLSIVAVGCIAPCDAYSTDRAQDANWYIIQPAQISVYFPTNGGDPAPVLAKMYNSANNTIDIAIYSITNQRIVDAIINARNKGIKVRVIADRQEANNQYVSGALQQMKSMGIPILINSHPGLMHMKLSIIDRTFATTGSYNYTTSASQTNDEIFIVCTEPLFINECQVQFDRMWADTKGFEKYGGNQ